MDQTWTPLRTAGQRGLAFKALAAWPAPAGHGGVPTGLLLKLSLTTV